MCSFSSSTIWFISHGVVAFELWDHVGNKLDIEWKLHLTDASIESDVSGEHTHDRWLELVPHDITGYIDCDIVQPSFIVDMKKENEGTHFSHSLAIFATKVGKNYYCKHTDGGREERGWREGGKRQSNISKRGKRNGKGEGCKGERVWMEGWEGGEKVRKRMAYLGSWWPPLTVKHCFKWELSYGASSGCHFCPMEGWVWWNMVLINGFCRFPFVHWYAIFVFSELQCVCSLCFGNVLQR